MIEQAPALIVAVPLGAALLLPLVAYRSLAAALWTTRLATASSFAFAVLSLARSLSSGPIRYDMAGFRPPWGIELVIDPLSGLVAALVSGIALLASFFAGPYLSSWSESRAAVFESVYLLLTAGLLGMTITGDLFNLFVFLEISSLSAYALIATGGSRAIVATIRYLLVGTVAGTFYLLGVGYFYALTGTLNMADLAQRLSGADSPLLAAAIALVTVGLAIKAALFPLHGWLPDAYTYAPGPVIGFIAAVMGKVSAYALYRILFFVLPAASREEVVLLLGWASAVAVIAGSVRALAQTDVQRMLAYSSVSQMGYIILGLAMGTRYALTGAVLHVVAHAVMKACLFMAANGMEWKLGAVSLRDFAGISRRLPLTAAAFTVAALSLIGIPPTIGFFSKYYLVLAAIEGGHGLFALALIASSLLSAVYLFRLLEQAYLAPEAPGGGELPAASDLPFPMLGPVMVLALLALALGLFNQSFVARLIAPGLPS